MRYAQLFGALALVSALFVSTISSAGAAAATTEQQVLGTLSPLFLNAVASAVKPAPDGTTGRNRGQWYGVADQCATFWLVASGVRGKNAAVVNRAFLVANAAFAQQSSDGGFNFNVARLGTTPNTTQLASQVGFFVRDFAHALLILRDSTWFQNSQTTVQLRAQVPGLEQKLSAALNYLINHRADLLADHGTANRLMIYADAYYLSGKLLNRDDGVSAGRQLMDAALAQQGNDGSFLELGGFDSSYQNVFIAEGIYLYLYMDGDPAQGRLWQAIQRGYQRELANVTPSGEISTQGNTRVGAGSVTAQRGGPVHVFDKTSAGFAFSYYAAITGSSDDEQRAASVQHFYFGV